MFLMPFSNCVLVCAIIIFYFPQLGFTQGSKKPVILSEREKIINVTDNLALTCEGNAPLEWKWPEIKDKNYLEWSHVQIMDVPPINKTYKYASRIRLQNATFLHTGYYYCFYKNISNENQIDKIYLYVRDKKYLCVNTERVQSVSVTQYSDAVIPCRPTSPEISIDFFWITGEKLSVNETNENGTIITFNPHYGYTTNDTQVPKQSVFYCVFSRAGQVTMVANSLNVEAMKGSLPKPEMEENRGGSIELGQELVLICKVRTMTSPVFTWITPTGPVDFKRMTVSSSNKYIDKDVMFQTLTIKNATMKDKGLYYCNVSDGQGHYSANSFNVIVYNVKEHFIHLHEKSGIHSLTVKPSVYVITWIVDIRGHPRPRLSWFNNKNEPIPYGNSFKYFTKSTPMETMLGVKNITLLDYGNYTIVAENEFETKSLSFFLNVTQKPTVKLEIREFYRVGEASKIICVATASPPPTVRLSFRSSQDNSSEFEDATVTLKQELLTVTAEGSMKPNRSGQVRCNATNPFGKDEIVKSFYMTDVKNGFDVFGFDYTINSDNASYSVNVSDGDELRMVCGASSEIYSDNITWWYEDKNLLSEENKVILEKSYTQYSYRLAITLQHITFIDRGNYICKVNSNGSLSAEKKVVLDVLAPSAPVINGGDIKKDIEVNYPEGIEIHCRISGFPVPTIRWFKNNLLIRESQRIRFTNNNQTLSFTSTRPEDEGIYSCEASNKIGVAKGEINLIIQDNSWTTWLIIIISVLFIILLVAGTFIFLKIRKERKLQRELGIAGLENFEKGALQHLNPKLTVADQAELLPYDKKWEFPIDKLKLGEQLGSGAFGVVMKAEAKGIINEEETTTVAVKMVKQNTDHDHIKALASELKIMIYLGQHLNVVNLLGACTRNIAKRELLVIVEYCRYGNLHNYLQRHRQCFIDQVNSETGQIDYTIGQDLVNKLIPLGNIRNNLQAPCFDSALSSAASGCNSNGSQKLQDASQIKPNYYNLTAAKAKLNVTSTSSSTDDEGVILTDNSSIQPEWRIKYRGDYENIMKPICTKDLLAWAFQVSRGMEYLASRRILHGDLAARNILLADDNVVKICDFGLAKSMYKYGNYKKKSDGPLPIKWMAIESIKDQIFSTQSDVWSFGIVLWELFSLAGTPYPGMDADERFYRQLLNGYRMESPKHAPKEIYKIMLDCWQTEPQMRPTFAQLSEKIGSILEGDVASYYIRLNDPYLAMNSVKLEGGQDYLTMLSPPTFDDLSSPNYYVNDLKSELDRDGYLRMRAANVLNEEQNTTDETKGEKDFDKTTAIELHPIDSTDADEQRLKFKGNLQKFSDGYLVMNKTEIPL